MMNRVPNDTCFRKFQEKEYDGQTPVRISKPAGFHTLYALREFMILVILLMSVLLFLKNLHIVYHCPHHLSTGNVP